MQYVYYGLYTTSILTHNADVWGVVQQCLLCSTPTLREFMYEGHLVGMNTEMVNANRHVSHTSTTRHAHAKTLHRLQLCLHVLKRCIVCAA